MLILAGLSQNRRVAGVIRRRPISSVFSTSWATRGQHPGRGVSVVRLTARARSGGDVDGSFIVDSFRASRPTASAGYVLLLRLNRWLLLQSSFTTGRAAGIHHFGWRRFFLPGRLAAARWFRRAFLCFISRWARNRTSSSCSFCDTFAAARATASLF